MSSIKLYDKVIKKKKIMTREEEALIFRTYVCTKNAVICEVIKNKEYFLKFKDIINHYITNDYLLDVALFDPSYWDGSSSDEIIEFYNNFTNSIIFAKSYSDISGYLVSVLFTDEIYHKVLDIVTEEDKLNLCHLISIIDSIKAKIVEHNMAMAIEICLKNKSTLNVHIDDAIQCAMVGLSIAIDKHNPLLNTKLSTSSYSWIYQTIQRYNDINFDIIQIPSNFIELNRKNSKIINKYMKEHDHYPSADKICELAGNDSYVICGNIYEDVAMNSDGVDGNRKEIKDDGLWDTSSKLEYNKISNRIKEIINKLNEKEQYVINMMFGLNETKETHTNKFIMDNLKIDNATFNKIKKSAFDTIRDNVDDDFSFENWRELFEEEVG